MKIEVICSGNFEKFFSIEVIQGFIRSLLIFHNNDLTNDKFHCHIFNIHAEILHNKLRGNNIDTCILVMR